MKIPVANWCLAQSSAWWRRPGGRWGSEGPGMRSLVLLRCSTGDGTTARSHPQTFRLRSLFVHEFTYSLLPPTTSVDAWCLDTRMNIFLHVIHCGAQLHITHSIFDLHDSLILVYNLLSILNRPEDSCTWTFEANILIFHIIMTTNPVLMCLFYDLT